MKIGFCGIETVNSNPLVKRNDIVQRVPVFFILALIFVALYYLTPLKDYMHSQYDGTRGKKTSSTKTQQKDEPFDKLSLELLVISNKVANLEGRLRILKMAEENPDWLSSEEYAQLDTVIAMTEDELEMAETEYERIRGEYARETATRIIRKSMEPQADGGRSSAEKEESIPYQYLD